MAPGGERLVPSASQTVGPFYAIGLGNLISEKVPALSSGAGSELVRVEGRLLDGKGVGVPDGFLEVWQADGAGRYASEMDLFEFAARGGERAAFPGFARVGTGADGSFRFTTVRPGAVPYDGDRLQAPHLLVLVFLRGLLRNLVTRMYFPAEESAGSGGVRHEDDPVLRLVAEARRGTLIAESLGPGRVGWDIRLRGERETVFFAW